MCDVSKRWKFMKEQEPVSSNPCCDREIGELMKQIDSMVEGQTKVVQQETVKLKEQLSMKDTEIGSIKKNSKEKDFEIDRLKKSISSMVLKQNSILNSYDSEIVNLKNEIYDVRDACNNLFNKPKTPKTNNINDNSNNPSLKVKEGSTGYEGSSDPMRQKLQVMRLQYLGQEQDKEIETLRQTVKDLGESIVKEQSSSDGIASNFQKEVDQTRCALEQSRIVELELRNELTELHQNFDASSKECELLTNELINKVSEVRSIDLKTLDHMKEQTSELKGSLSVVEDTFKVELQQADRKVAEKDLEIVKKQKEIQVLMDRMGRLEGQNEALHREKELVLKKAESVVEQLNVVKEDYNKLMEAFQNPYATNHHPNDSANYNTTYKSGQLYTPPYQTPQHSATTTRKQNFCAPSDKSTTTTCADNLTSAKIFANNNAMKDTRDSELNKGLRDDLKDLKTTTSSNAAFKTVCTLINNRNSCFTKSQTNQSPKLINNQPAKSPTIQPSRSPINQTTRLAINQTTRSPINQTTRSPINQTTSSGIRMARGDQKVIECMKKYRTLRNKTEEEEDKTDSFRNKPANKTPTKRLPNVQNSNNNNEGNSDNYPTMYNICTSEVCGCCEHNTHSREVNQIVSEPKIHKEVVRNKGMDLENDNEDSKDNMPSSFDKDELVWRSHGNCFKNENAKYICGREDFSKTKDEKIAENKYKYKNEIDEKMQNDIDDGVGYDDDTKIEITDSFSNLYRRRTQELNNIFEKHISLLQSS